MAIEKNTITTGQWVTYRGSLHLITEVHSNGWVALDRIYNLVPTNELFPKEVSHLVEQYGPVKTQKKIRAQLRSYGYSIRQAKKDRPSLFSDED